MTSQAGSVIRDNGLLVLLAIAGHRRNACVATSEDRRMRGVR